MESVNPFAKISTVNDAETISEKAKKKAMQSSVKGTSEAVNPVIRYRRTETKRIENYARLLREKLNRILEEFPHVEKGEIHDFYIDMVDLIIPLDEFHQILGSLKGSVTVIWKIAREHVSQIWQIQEPIAIKQSRRAAFSRINSVMKKLDKRLKKLEDLRQIMRFMPAFDFDEIIICIAGYPNAGKSTFVSIITTASPAIGRYPFTTKEATLGHYKSEHNYRTCQIVDTPGILDRPFEERNDIEKKAFIAINSLPNSIIFLIDPTEEYPLDNQINLAKDILNYVKEDMWIAITKIDLISSDDLVKFKKRVSEEVKTKLSYEKEIFEITNTNQDLLINLVDTVLTEIPLPQIKPVSKDVDNV